ncbi:MAG TPA: hypothetical protein VGM96_13795 [Reyranella sp.]|jgi:hypothetical protein
MKPIVALLLLSFAANVANAQAGRDSCGDGGDARTDALLGTPNKATPVPQTNLFSTSPGLEQRAPTPQGTDQRKDPGAPGAPEGKQP